MRSLWTVVVALSLAATAGLLATETRWARVGTPHFVVSGDASAGELERAAARLESLRGAFAEILPRFRDRSLLPTFVVVFGNDTSFAPFKPPGVTVGGYALLEPFIPSMVLRSTRADEAFRTIVHEYVHVVFDAPAAPPWLSEGVADYYSTTGVDRDGTRAVTGERIAAHVSQASRWWIPLAQVLTRTDAARLSNGNDSESFYAESWLLVHYLTRSTPEKGAQIVRFIDLLAAGVAQPDAFEQAIGVPEKVEAELLRYLRNGIIFGDQRTLARPMTRSTSRAQPMSGAEVDATLGRLLYHLRRDDEAMARLTSASSAAPDLAETSATLGLMMVRRGRRAEAATHFRRAVAKEPANMLAAYHLGRMALDGIRTEGTPSLDDAYAALSSALTSPSEAPANVLAMHGTLAGRVGRLDDAEASLRRAIADAPGERSAMLELANVCLRTTKFDEAHRILDALSTDRASSDARVVKQYLEWLALAEARAAMRTELAEIAGLSSPGPDLAIARTGSFLPLPTLRTPAAGEQRRLGLLDAVDCTDKEFLVRVSTRVGQLVLRSATLGRVHLSSARTDVGDTIPCGARREREAVYVSWTGEGQLTALEFLPANLQPVRPAPQQ